MKVLILNGSPHSNGNTSFIVNKLKDVKDLMNNNDEVQTETKKEITIEEEPKKKEQLTMSDFFEEFKL